MNNKRMALPDKNFLIQNSVLIRLVFVVLIVILVVFASFQILQWTLLTGLESQSINRLHFVRGITASMAVAVAVVLIMLRASPIVLLDKSSEKEWVQEATEKDRIEYYSRWFIRMRWVAALVAFTLVFVATRITSLLPQEVWWPLFLITVCVAATNLVFNYLLKHGKLISNHLLIQVYSDLILLTFLLHFSGGIENQLSLLTLIHVIIAGIFLTKRQCYTVAGVAGVLFAFLAFAEWSHLLEHYTLLIFPHGEGEHVHAAHQTLYVVSRIGLQFALLFLTAYFVTALSEESRSYRRRSERMAERALAERQLLEQSLETTNTGLRVVDKQLRPLWMNHWWKEWFGECTEKNEPHLENAICAAERATMQDGSIRTTEIDFPKNSDRSLATGRVFQVTTAPLSDKNGKVTEVVHLAQDITEQKRTQIQMMQAGKMAVVGELAGNIAHEVNNPIAIVSAKARLLLSDNRSEMSEKVAVEISKIINLSDRVAHIAKGLLSYCRSSGADRIPLDIRVPIRKALAMVEHRAKTEGVRIEDRIDGSRLFVPANINEMEQVFLNLFLNALDAMPQGGCLKISSNCDAESFLEVLVEDTGTGISKEIQNKIFEPFFTTKQEGRGAGLGLSICLGLVRSHGGSIDIRSEPGHRTRVSVKLPRTEVTHA
ncbi:MAG TPA: ATP-binding protein [Acidobacteriota bacterium]|nr:ATP-binding protein [Acidobacteriota bacterium]